MSDTPDHMEIFNLPVVFSELLPREPLAVSSGPLFDIKTCIDYWNDLFATADRTLRWNGANMFGLGHGGMVIATVYLSSVDPANWIATVNAFATWFFLVATKPAPGATHASK